MYARNLSESEYRFLIKQHEDAGIKNVNNPTAFIVCSNTVNDVCKNIDNYNPKRDKKKVLTVLMT